MAKPDAPTDVVKPDFTGVIQHSPGVDQIVSIEDPESSVLKELIGKSVRVSVVVRDKEGQPVVCLQMHAQAAQLVLRQILAGTWKPNVSRKTDRRVGTVARA